MNDWIVVGRNALWIAGLALVLAAFSRGHWLAGRLRVQSRIILVAAGYRMALDIGLMLVSVSLLLGAHSTWGRLGWSALAVLPAGLATNEWRRRRLSPHDAGPGQQPVVSTPVVPRCVPSTSVVPGWLARWVGRVELWWVFATLPFLLFPGRWAAWAVASLVLLWIMRWITTGRITARTPVDWPVLVLVLMLPVAVWVSGDLQMSLVAMYRLIGGIALFYAVVNWVSSGQRLVAATAMLALIGVGLAVLALLATTTWGLPKLFNPAPILAWLQIHVRPLIPEDINANVLGGGLALVWPVVAALLFGRLGESRRQTLWLRLGLAGSLLCMTPVLLLTQCQGALLGVAVAVAFMATLRWPRLRLCAALAGLAVLVWLARGGTGQLLQVADRLFSTSTGTSLSGRPEVWSASIHMVEDFPLTGIGLGTFDRVQALRYPFSLLHEQVHHAHNLLLAVAVDMGLPGAVAYLALLLGAVYTTWRTWQETRFRGESAFLNSLALGLLGGQTALLAHGMLDAAAWANKLAVIAWFMLGLTMAAGGLTADRPSPDPSPVEADA